MHALRFIAWVLGILLRVAREGRKCNSMLFEFEWLPWTRPYNACREIVSTLKSCLRNIEPVNMARWCMDGMVLRLEEKSYGFLRRSYVGCEIFPYPYPDPVGWGCASPLVFSCDAYYMWASRWVVVGLGLSGIGVLARFGNASQVFEKALHVMSAWTAVIMRLAVLAEVGTLSSFYMIYMTPKQRR